MYAKLTILGRLGADPEMRYTNSGVAVTSLNVATDIGWGEKKSTLWVRVSCWGRPDKPGLAQVVADHLRKGSIVFCVGDPTIRTYTTQSGENRVSLEMRADDVKFASPKPADGNRGARARSQPGSGQASNQPGPNEFDGDWAPPDDNYGADEVPF